MPPICVRLLTATVLLLTTPPYAPHPTPPDQRTQSFDRDPDWDGYRNRSAVKAGREVTQDFGYDAKTHAVGGLITPAWEASYYAKRVPTRTFEDKLTASGTLNCTSGKFHALLGFFNADTLGAWRTPNTLNLRIIGRGEYFYAYVEYATGRFRAGGDSPQGFAERDPATGKSKMREFPLNTPLRWTFDYDPRANRGGGALTIKLGDTTAICHLGEGHKADGATFNRFGLLNVMKSVDDAGEVWLNDVTIDGQREDFTKDPGWDGKDNRRGYTTTRVRPAFDFGYSPTQHAGGKGRGELGGVTFRGDGRYADKMGYYGDRLETLDLTKPLSASGRVCLRRAASDSTTLLGFFHSKESIAVVDEQKSSWPQPFLGIVVEGPSSDGFFVYPAYRIVGDGYTNHHGENPPSILPEGKSHAWSLEYTPGDPGKITATLDGKSVTITIPKDQQQSATRFDRFGIISTRIDGNGQEVYFDDLAYTARQ